VSGEGAQQWPDDDSTCRCVDCDATATGRETCGWIGRPKRTEDDMCDWDKPIDWRCPNCAEHITKLKRRRMTQEDLPFGR
jgi:hypothetical protein